MRPAGCPLPALLPSGPRSVVCSLAALTVGCCHGLQREAAAASQARSVERSLAVATKQAAAADARWVLTKAAPGYKTKFCLDERI